MTNEKYNLMKLFMHNPELYRELCLSPFQTRIIFYIIKHGPTLSKDVAYKFGLSIQHSSTTLTKLYKKGYLYRSNVGDETGGKEYEYISFLALFRAKNHD